MEIFTPTRTTSARWKIVVRKKIHRKAGPGGGGKNANTEEIYPGSRDFHTWEIIRRTTCGFRVRCHIKSDTVDTIPCYHPRFPRAARRGEISYSEDLSPANNVPGFWEANILRRARIGDFEDI